MADTIDTTVTALAVNLNDLDASIAQVTVLVVETGLEVRQIARDELAGEAKAKYVSEAGKRFDGVRKDLVNLKRDTTKYAAQDRANDAKLALQESKNASRTLPAGSAGAATGTESKS